MRSFAYIPDDDRLRERLSETGSISDVFPSTAGIPPRQLALIFWSGGKLGSLAVMARGSRVANYKIRVRLSDEVDLVEGVDLEKVIEALDARHGDLLRRAVERGGGQLTEETTAAIGQALHKLGRIAGEAWDTAVEQVAQPSSELWPSDEDAVPAIAYERDAVGLSLALTGMDREGVLGAWNGDMSAHFVQGAGIALSEDQAIAQDAQVFGDDWQRVTPGPIAARYVQGGRTLSILVANRVKLERVLGVDLIYYSHDYDSYVFVQYKRMRHRLRWEFHPDSDRNFGSELDRMREVAKLGGQGPGPASHRLGPNFCFLKFCEGETKDISSSELTRGIYLPIDLWDKLVASDQLTGPRGGTVLNYDNAGRWLNNTTFIGLVEDCWIGTSGLSSREVGKIVSAAIDADHTVVMAAGSTARRGRGRRR